MSELEKISKALPALSAALIILGIVHSVGYYTSFKINITEFAELIL